MKKLPLLIIIVVFFSPLSACQKPHPEPWLNSQVVPNSNTALAMMERVALAANTCWFRSRDTAFRPYRLAPELNSFSGRPRILIVPAKNPGGRPFLVVQAEGNPVKMEVFGPLMHQPIGSRIIGDVHRWAADQRSCSVERD